MRPAILILALGILAATAAGCSRPDAQEAAGGRFFWPPRVGERYPDLTLPDHTGRLVSLSEFEGRLILLEPVGTSCPGCQAFAGGNRAGVGGFDGVVPQRGLGAIEDYLGPYGGGASIDDPGLVYVQLLLYDRTATKAPTVEEARRWAEHFGMDRGGNRVVLVGEPALIGPASYAMIPGFQLIDRDFVLRVDSTGHAPRHDLWRELLPELGRRLREGAPRPAAVGRAIGQAMPDFALPGPRGAATTLSSLRGLRPAFLYFYSGCCGHCSRELSKVAVAAERFSERGAVVIGVQYLGDRESCARQREEFELPGTILADGDGGVCRMLGVGDFTVFAVDARGTIRYRGPLDGLPADLADEFSSRPG